jgi:hypothetical protein
MELHQGDRVLVNLAPFVGLAARSRHVIPCEVLAIEGQQVQVATSSPYRDMALWVGAEWIEGKPPEGDVETPPAGPHLHAAHTRRAGVCS